MLIQQTTTEIIIRLPAHVDTEGLQRLINFLEYREMVATSRATQEQIDLLAKQVNLGWWEKNKDKFIK
jgi:hypothetical protein